MVGMGLREFPCTLCGQTIESYSGDLLVPQPEVCDACLPIVWEMDDESLKLHIAKCMEDEDGFVTPKKVYEYVQWFKTTYANAADALKARNSFW